jgi:N-acetylated-alpha-linked acidic dipeptidase
LTEGFLPQSTEAIRSLNGKLKLTERALTHADGLSGRPWFKHLIYAPGAYTGYGVKTIPGVREAMELKRWKEADVEIVRVAAALQNEANIIEAVAREADAQPTK